jgi:formate dehydrogenase alpha subunit
MMKVNGREVEAHGTLLEACRRAGVELAAFCHDGALPPGGHCRACMVEVDGRPQAACVTPARDGAEVRTHTERLRAYRRDLGELMRAESLPGGWVGRTLHEWGVDGLRYRRPSRRAVRDASHVMLRIDLDACILCRRCVRACEEIQGQFVYAVEGRGAGAQLGWGGVPLAETDCVSCGACVATCPTGAITDTDRETAPVMTRVERTTCGYCGVGCQLDVHAAGDRIVRIEGAQAEVNRGHLCVKGRYAHVHTRHPDRLTTPLIRRDGQLVPASWEEAIATVARELERRKGAVAGLSSSRCTNEENYLFQKWMRAGLGTHDVDCCARVCHAPSAAGLRTAFGMGAATNSLADIAIADVLMVVGANVTEAHPVTGARIKQAVLHGARLIVVDPRVTELAAMADVHLQGRPGSNVPLLNALACALVDEGLVDRAFVAARTEGAEDYEAFIRGETPERHAAVTGVSAERVRAAARLYGRAARPMMVHGLGVTEHLQGSEAVMLLCNLALLAGAIGRPGTGVNPLRGQNNVQGAADMGCQPDLLTGYVPLDDAAGVRRFEAAWGRPMPQAPGRILPEMYAAAKAGAIRAMFIFGEDVMQTDPDTRQVREALESLEFLAVQELFLTDTARLAHVVLPGASALEKDGTFTNGERRIQRVRQVLPPTVGSRADWEILGALMEAGGLGPRVRNPGDVWEEIARVAPVFAGVRFERLEGDGLQWPVPAPGHPGTAILHAERFPRGRGRFTRVVYEPSPELGGALTLTTGRVLEHYNSGSMTRRSGSLRLAPEDALEIHPADAAARGIADGDPVAITSAHGEARAHARLTTRVPAGVVFLSFHFPETGANRLTGEVRDSLSGCPEYKVTAVEVRRGA